MKVHLVHAHFEERSFTAAMRDTAVAAFRARGDSVTVSDLYGMGFNPVASAADFAAPANPGHIVYALEQRHAFRTGTLAPDIAGELALVLDADLLAFTFPVFWFSVPAILKGWFDRVLLSGVAYGGRRIYGAGGLAGRRAFVALSLGGREHMFGPGSLHGELATGMLRHFFQGSLGYVGLAVHEPFVAWHTPYVTDDERRATLDRLAAAVAGVDDRPTLRMPDLGAFDATFAPVPGGG
jgi:NAD(P)H dehydrogenase (quinone)